MFSECRSATDFKCKNSVCLPEKVTCDGYDHCGDGSDEDELCGASVLLNTLISNCEKIARRQYVFLNSPNTTVTNK